MRQTTLRWWWNLERFGFTPAKLKARLIDASDGPSIVSNSLPKAGTHLLERALCLHPAVYRAPVPTIHRRTMARTGDLHTRVPRLGPHEMLVAHLEYSPQREMILNRSDVRSIFMIRDPRDIAVSQAHFIPSRPDHGHYETFADVPDLDARIRLVIEGNAQGGFPSLRTRLEEYEGWLTSASLVVRYEDLIGASGGGDHTNQIETLRRVFEHIELGMPDHELEQLATAVFSGSSPTFRRGTTQQWRAQFDESTTELFETRVGDIASRSAIPHHDHDHRSENLVPTNKTLSKVRLRVRDALLGTRKSLTKPEAESPSDNVFHCCLHKSGSQWIRRILRDARVYQYSGLEDHHYQSSMPGGHDPRPVTERRFTSPFPLRTIVTPLYIDYAGYCDIPKPDSSRAFFVTRDPRDIVVSWYFSSKYSHRIMGDLAEARGILSDLDEVDGLEYSIRHLAGFGLFEAQRSWLDAADDPTCLVVRFEDLIGPDAEEEFVRLFDHCRIAIPRPTLGDVLETYSFERLSGRARGDEAEQTHFRKGVAGDWMNHFGPEVQQVFDEVTGDLVEQLGYEPV